jgi:hypothetical protein
VVTLNLTANSPLVISGSHTGSSNFAVTLVGTGAAAGAEELLFNQIGWFKGQTAVTDISAGPYRVAVEADGAWVLRFQQPIPTGNERGLLGVVSGSGSQVIPVQTHEDLRPVATATHRGQSNFAVYLMGLGDLTGESLLFNEIGNFNGETLVDELPTGPYLLRVEADGAWTLKFAR